MAVLRIFTDGASRGNPGEAAAGVAIYGAEGTLISGHHQYLGLHTNNEAEYLAVKYSLTWFETSEGRQALESGEIDKIEWYLDSKLVVEQLMKRWKIKEARLAALALEIWQELTKVNLNYSFHHVPREQNKLADSLANQALDERAGA